MSAFAYTNPPPLPLHGQKAESMNPKGEQIFPLHGLAWSLSGDTMAKVHLEMMRHGHCVEWRVQWPAENNQGQQSPAVRWRASSSVKASNGVLGDCSQWQALGQPSASSVSAQAWFSRLLVDSVGCIHTRKDIFCVSPLALTCVCNQELWLEQNFNFIQHPIS